MKTNTSPASPAAVLDREIHVPGAPVDTTTTTETIEQIGQRLAVLRSEQARIQRELDERASQEHELRLKVNRERIAALPASFGLPDLMAVIRFLAKEADVEMRLYGTGANRPTPRAATTRAATPKGVATRKGNPRTNPHGKGFRLPEHADARLMELLRMRRDGKSTITISSLRRQFGLAGQSIYARIARLAKEGKGKAHRRAA